MENINLKYDGKLSQLYLIWLKNTILSFLTLLIYRSWAKTRMRRYIYQSFTIFGDRLEYTGTGGELFKGLLKVSLYVFVISIIFQILHYAVVYVAAGSAIDWLFTLIDFVFTPIIVISLLFYGKFSSLHYRLTRSAWRGIRGRLDGRPKEYMLFCLKRTVIDICSLGYSIARSDLLKRQFIVRKMYLGNQNCTFECDITSLDKINLKTLLLAIPTLGLSRIWYKAALLCCYWNNMKAGSISFHADYTGKTLFNFMFGNMLLLIFTFGFGMPIIINRMVKLFVGHVSVFGQIEGSNITQVASTAQTTGEGIITVLSQYDGLDFDLGLI